MNIRPELKRWLVILAVAAISLALAASTYNYAVAHQYVEAEAAIAAAHPAAVILSEDPTTAVSRDCDASAGHFDEARTLRLLQLVSALPADARSEDIPQSVRRAFGIEPGREAVSFCEPGVDLLIRIAQAVGSESSSTADERDVRTETAPYIIAILVGEPGSAAEYKATVDHQLRGEEAPERELPSGYWNPFRPKTFSGESHARALQILFTQTGVDFTNVDGLDERRAIERDVIVGLSRSIAMAIERDDRVRAARWWIQVVQGAEQFFTLLTFLFAVGLASVSKWTASSAAMRGTMEERAFAAHNDRWLIRWSVAAMPAIGFIGTIRGLGDALGKADTIVTATTRIEQAAAIGDVAITLAFAFTTTLVALVAALIAGFVDAASEWWQRARIAEQGGQPASDVVTGSSSRGRSEAANPLRSLDGVVPKSETSVDVEE